MTPDWIQAYASVLTLIVAGIAGYYAKRAAEYTKQQATAADDQVRIAKDALKVTRDQATAAENHGNKQVALAGDGLELNRKEVHLAKVAAAASYKTYQESKLDAAAPVLLATVKRRGWFLEIREAEWAPTWEPFSQARYFEEKQNNLVSFRIQLDVHLENMSQQIARVDIVNPAHGDVSVRSGEAIIIPPGQERAFVWTRIFTPAMLATEEDINNPQNWLFDLTLWVRDLGMNVRDTYKFNSDLRLFKRDGTRLLVQATPDHDWVENFAQPLPERTYERLIPEHVGSVDLSGSGTLGAEAQRNPS